MKKTIVFGSLNTDLILNGVPKIIGPGELTSGKSMQISAGGKSRNIVAMLATLNKSGENIEFIGKTSRDAFGFWKYPIESLQKLGVGTANIKFMEGEIIFPGLALIPVDVQGNNQIYLLPGANNEFSSGDIEDFFQNLDGNSIDRIVLTFEMPFETAQRIIKYASELNIKTFLDPGGISVNDDMMKTLSMGGYLIKPNEHEASLITGIQVQDFNSAKVAGRKLIEMGFENILITHGENGAYLISQEIEVHIPAPNIESIIKSSVGCGDQVMAGILFGLDKGYDIQKSCKIGVIAGTLQFGKAGIESITQEELLNHIND